MKKIHINWQEFDIIVKELIGKIKLSDEKFDGVYGIPRGGLILAVYISHQLNIPLLIYPAENTLVVDDISDEGKTLSSLKNRRIATLYSTPWTKTKPDWFVRTKDDGDSWIVFPWENQESEKKL